MGVTSLWSVLKEVGEEHSILSDAGLTLAIDLSSWIVQGMKAGNQIRFANEIYIMFRTIFFRTMELLKLGIKPVFVVDGKAPAVKEVTLGRRKMLKGGSPGSDDRNRKRHREISDQCCQLFCAFGIPCVKSPGEAEKMCAYLNTNQLVDAVLCDDSDVFLYGAQTVYTNFDLKKNKPVVKYKMEDIKERLGLDRQSLVAFALLTGSDYSDGIHGIGKTNALKLIKSMKKKYGDVLERIFSWKDDNKLMEMSEQLRLPRTTSKPTHCSKCVHLGKVSQHKSHGCCVCCTQKDCTPSSSDVCTCSWHQNEKKMQPYLIELGVWEKAMKVKDFPQKEIVDEFLVDDTVPMEKLEWKMPHSLSQIHSVLKTFLNWNETKVNLKVLPVLVHMHLHGIVGKLNFKPISIERSRKQNSKACFEIKWTVTDIPDTEENSFEVAVMEDLFASKYSKMTLKYRDKLQAKKSGNKRKLQVDKKEKTLDSFYKIKKRKFVCKSISSAATGSQDMDEEPMTS